MELPPFHVDLLRKLREGAAHLREADALWRDLPPPMPTWVAPVFVVVTVVGVIALVVLWAALFIDAIGGPGRGFVVFVMAPVFVALQLGLELLAWWSPFARLERELSAVRDPRFHEIARCRHCGAPLAFGETTVVVRCAHCQSDNLVRRLRSTAFRAARETAEQARRQIDEAIATVRMLRQQRTLIRWLGPGIMVPLWAVLAFALWSR